MGIFDKVDYIDIEPALFDTVTCVTALLMISCSECARLVLQAGQHR